MQMALRGCLGLVVLLVSASAEARRDDVEQLRQPPPDPIVTYVDYEEARPEKLPYPRNGHIPPGYVVESSGKTLSWVLGTVLVVTLPLSGVGVAKKTEMKAAWIPLAGPWIALGQFDSSLHRGAEPLTLVWLLASSGLAQGVGWGMLAHAAFSPTRRYLVREDVAVVPRALPGGGWSLEWSGSF